MLFLATPILWLLTFKIVMFKPYGCLRREHITFQGMESKKRTNRQEHTWRAKRCLDRKTSSSEWKLFDQRRNAPFWKRPWEMATWSLHKDWLFWNAFRFEIPRWSPWVGFRTSRQGYRIGLPQVHEGKNHLWRHTAHRTLLCARVPFAKQF